MGATPQEHEAFQQVPIARRIWRETGLVTAKLLACAAALYVIGLNVFLETRLFRNAINQDISALRVEYTSAYSILPGQIHVEGLTIRGRDSAVEWILRIDSCDFRIAFSELIHKRFHASHVRATGLAMRARLRIDPADATPGLVAALPPVPGFSDPPYLGPAPPLLTDANYHLWMVRLDDVDVQHVREVWIQTIRGEGDMRVRGRWLFRPVRWLEVGPASVDVAALDVWVGGRPLATNLHGHVEATVHPFDVREPDGLEVLRYVSATTQLRGVAMTANALTTLLPASDVRFARAQGPLDAHVLLEHGVLVDGTRVWTESPDTKLVIGKLVFDAPVRVDLRVEGSAGFLHARCSDCRISSIPTAQADATSIEATVVSHHLDVTHAFDDATFVVDVQGAKTHDLDAWGACLLPASTFGLRADLVTAECRVEGSLVEGRAKGQMEFAARGFSASQGRDRLAGEVTGHIELRDLVAAEKRIDLSGSHVVLQNAHATWRGIHAHASTASLRASRAIITPGLPDADFDVVLPRVGIDDLRQLGAVLPAGAPFVITGGRAAVSARLRLSLSAQHASGAATIVADGVGARYGAAIVEGRLVARVALRRWSLVDHAFELGRSDVVLRDVSVRADLAARPHADILSVSSLTLNASRLAVGPSGNEGSISLDVPSATIVDLSSPAMMAALPSDVCVERGRVDASLHAETDLRSGSTNGDSHVVVRDFRARFGATTVAAALSADLRARRASSNRASGLDSVDLSGSTVAVTEGRIGHGAATWLGNIEMGDAIFRSRDGASFHADLRGTATDASPATVLLADNAGVPTWAANIFRMPHLQVSGEIRATGSSLELRSVVARGGATSVQMEYARHGTRQEGAVLMDLGWVELGYDLTTGSSGLVVLDSAGWFGRKATRIRANASAFGLADKQPSGPSRPVGVCVP